MLVDLSHVYVQPKKLKKKHIYWRNGEKYSIRNSELRTKVKTVKSIVFRLIKLLQLKCSVWALSIVGSICLSIALLNDN